MREINIYSDCKEAIKSLRNPYVRSITVKNCMMELNNLSESNYSVTVRWIPSHAGISGNVIADSIAKKSLNNDNQFIEIVPKSETVKEKIFMGYENENFRKHWMEKKSLYNFSHVMMGELNEVKSTLARNCPRRELKILIGCLTGHACHRKFLKRIGVIEHDRCRFCKRDIPEDMNHLLHHCETLKESREKIFGSKYLNIGELHDCDYRNLIKFCKITEIQKIFNKFND